MPLGPLRDACVRPAPKSRFVVSGLLRKKIKIKTKINGNGNGNGNGNATVNAGLLLGCVLSRDFKVEHQCLWELLESCDGRGRDSDNGGGSAGSSAD
jgi:hypothetical protein